MSGCVPKKLYVYAAQFGKGFEDARGFGWDSTTPRFDWATLRDNKKTEIARLNGIYRKMLDGAGAQLHRRARAYHRCPHRRRRGTTLHRRKNTYSDRRLAPYSGLSRQRVRCYLQRNFRSGQLSPNAWSLSAVAISPWNSPAFSMAWAHTPHNSIEVRYFCAGSMPISARTPPGKLPKAG